jgi:hypothetical protein
MAIKKPEVRADVSATRMWEPHEPLAYRYVGPQELVLVVMDGTAYDCRRGEVVILPHPVNHTDFVKVPMPEGDA